MRDCGPSMGHLLLVLAALLRPLRPRKRSWQRCRSLQFRRHTQCMHGCSQRPGSACASTTLDQSVPAHRFCTAAVGALASLALATAAEVFALRSRAAAPAGDGSTTLHAASRAGQRAVLQPLAAAVDLLALARLLRGAASLMWRAMTAPLPV